MNSILSKSTFYDLVSMLIPGFILIFSALKIFFPSHEVENIFSNSKLGFPNYVCIIALSYLLGLAIHRLSQCVIDPFFRNRKECIKAAKTKFERDIAKRQERPERKINDTEVEGEYYIAYFKVIGSSPSIPIMEAQVSFIKSMIIVILLDIFFLALCLLKCCECVYAPFDFSPCCVMLLLLILALVSIVVMFHIQNKIYYLIFEADYYLDFITQDKSEHRDSINNL